MNLSDDLSNSFLRVLIKLSIQWCFRIKVLDKLMWVDSVMFTSSSSSDVDFSVRENDSAKGSTKIDN